MNKELTMTIHEFMNVQRGQCTYKDLEDYNNFLDNLDTRNLPFEVAEKLATTVIMLGVMCVVVPKTIEIITFANTAVESVTYLNSGIITNSAHGTIDTQTLKEGLDILYSTTTTVLQYSYKLLKLAIQSM